MSSSISGPSRRFRRRGRAGALAASAPSRGFARGLNAADLGLILLLVAAGVYLIAEGHGNRFFYDEWTWIEFRSHGISAILHAYNQHMMIVPLAVYQLLFHTVGLDHYHWYRLAATLAHLLLVAAVYLFARSRIGALALVLVVPLAFFGAGWEFVLWGINFGYTLSLALAILALVWFDGDSRSSLVGCLLLIASLLCSETALLFAVGLGIELTWRDRNLRRAWVWLVPILLYGLWYVGFYNPTAASQDLTAIPGFGAQLAAAASGGMFGQGEAGGLLGSGSTAGWILLGFVLALLADRLLRRRAASVRLLVVSVVALGYWALVAYGRAKLGEPNASRYVYVGAVLLLLIVVESLRDIELNWRSALAFVVVCAAALIGNLHAFGFGEQTLFEGSNSEAAELTALSLIRSTVAPHFVLDPHWSPQITPADYFPVTRQLGSTGADTLTQLRQAPEVERAAADDVLVRGGELTLAHPTAPAPAHGPAPGPPRVELALRGALSRPAGCVRFRPFGAGATLDVGLPVAGLSIRTEPAPAPAAAPGTRPPSAVRVRRFASGYENGPVASMGPGARVEIRARADAAAGGWHVRISPWATVTVCTVGG